MLPASRKIDYDAAISMLLIALLMLPGLLLLVGVVLLFLYRGQKEANAADWRREGRCQHCGYDLRGNASGVCPECGTVIPREL